MHQQQKKVCYLMTVESVEELALEQVEYLERVVLRGGEQVVAGRVKGDRVDGLRVVGVVLYELVGADVPDLDGGVGGAGGDERAARMEAHAVHVARVLVELVHTLLRVPVPQADRLVVRRRHDQSIVIREPCCCCCCCCCLFFNY